MILVLIFAYLLLSRGNGHTYDLLFESGGQLVGGNLVMVGGHPVGAIDNISLTDDNQARIQVTVDQELHEGSTAVIRATSLSGVANRYISVSPGPNSKPEIPENGTISSINTTSPVDLDQLFNTFTPRMRRAFSDFIKGNAGIWEDTGRRARTSLKYFAPALNQTTLWLREFNSDERMFSRFITNSAALASTVASRDDQLTSALNNANRSFGAIASENESLSRALQALPPTMRQANTTFVNLRAAFDDLDPLVAASKPATENLAPFLRDLQPVLSRGVGVFRDLSLTMHRPGIGNDMGDLTKTLPQVQPRTER
ncbi:MAG TPA: MlaD family protein, partial [Solirubrobacterales bacterium]|nr:MlaD family protein [Solirubrobacterales bacterium]